jgi:hypothetical protein
MLPNKFERKSSSKMVCQTDWTPFPMVQWVLNWRRSRLNPPARRRWPVAGGWLLVAIRAPWAADKLDQVKIWCPDWAAAKTAVFPPQLVGRSDNSRRRRAAAVVRHVPTRWTSSWWLTGCMSGDHRSNCHGESHFSHALSSLPLSGRLHPSAEFITVARYAYKLGVPRAL